MAPKLPCLSSILAPLLPLGLWLASAGCAARQPLVPPIGQSPCGSQTEQVQPEIDAFLEELYRSFCFDPGAEADWEAMERLFVSGASFVSPIRPSEAVQVQDAKGFLADFRRWIQTSEVGRTGLHERIVRTRIERFGSIAHAYVTFEGFVPTDGIVQTLGLDSLQLVLDRGTWKLSSFSSQYASANEPLPAQFAPANSGASEQ